MATKQVERQRVTIIVECDTERLYASVSEAALYLDTVAKQYASTDISLAEHWSGYEDMNMQFEYSREETDAEVANRREIEALQARDAVEALKRAAVRKEKEKQFEKLRRELGR